MPRQDIPKAYEAKQYEDGIYAVWETSGLFNPDNLPGERTESFSIVLPPPNVTGTLHMGHAVMLAIEDIMVRFERMRGKRALWIPGTDHAAIATQAKVEKNLIKSGLKDPRRELGREAFLKHVEEFASQSHDVIVNQARKMGASLDWSREAYTLDAARNRAVNVAFKKMFDDGIVYRGYRVVNWCPRCQSTLADDEVSHKETTATLYTFRYAKEFPVAISSTRPETKIGDTGVAVHPDDVRYASFVGKEYWFAFAGHPEIHVKIVADASVDPEFGTGALGVTPSHSQIDSDIATRHDLTYVTVIGEDGLMTNAAGALLRGLPVREAREKVVAYLRENGLLEDEKEVAQNLSVCYRCDTPVEPLPKLQWFIAVNKEFERDGKRVTLKGLMQDAVRSGSVTIMPDRFDKTYFHWIDNLRDWNISRQIWFGHRVPAWYRAEEIAVGEAPEGDGWTQDEDTFDTWFSSGLWTFSTLGWPDKTKDLETFHPTSVLETGYDILFFWVARMILMSTYLLGEVPFKTVYLHGLVRDEQGRKMSKSLDNIIDPLTMIETYGADATRLSLVIGSTPGNDQKLSEEKVAGYRNFTNKLWNIARFVLGTVESDASTDAKAVTLADRWILSRLDAVTESVTKKLAAYEISAAGEELRDFTWGDFADWYLEIAKTQKGANTDAILVRALETIVRLWHPFMPFVTEQIWSQFREGTLMVAEWPKAAGTHDASAEAAFGKLQAAVVEIRNIRATQKIEPAKKVSIVVSDASLLDHAEAIRFLARVEEMTVGDTPGIQLLLGAADVDAERARLSKERDELASYIASTDAKLANAEFTAKAPEKIVAQMKSKRDEAAAKLAQIESQLSQL